MSGGDQVRIRARRFYLNRIAIELFRRDCGVKLLSRLFSALMELTQEINSDRPMIQSYDASGVTISGRLFAESFILMPRDTDPQIWAIEKFQDISTDVLDALFCTSWDALLLGTGSEHHLPGPDLLKLMARRNRTIDFMPSRSACATFNLLSMDHREVATAIILPLGH